MDIWTPSFHPDLVKTGIQKVEFKSKLWTQISPSWWLEKYWIQKVDLKSSLFTQISPSWQVDFKSGVSVELKWSLKVDIWTPSFQPNSVKTGIQKVEFKSSLCTQISPSWWLGKYWIQKVEFKSSLFTQISPSWQVDFKSGV